MSKLGVLQADFQAYVMRDQPGIEMAVVGDNIAPATRRLQVYHDAYRLRLTDVLRNDFSGLAKLLGEAEWQSLCLEYLAAHPSTYTSVRWLGRDLESYLDGTSQWSARPYLAEMAAFEWAWGRAFDAADALSLAPGDLAEISPDAWSDMTLTLHPSLQRLSLHWNVPAVFSAQSHGEALPEWVASEQAVPWLLWRQDLTVFWRSLAAAEAHALAMVSRGNSFASLCDALCAWYAPDSVPQQAVQFLQQWFADGLVVAIRASSN